ncbi:hemerythrin domain-containing protein [Nocardioides seonyuensis]|uniref:Hemerythrin domain-containing protein n=1 Tax=Nocardioides seonyuensis TaxID=2518371 RepID=A0A4V1BMR9_9ACTN|nr:hemerythrin domain-containing protein [Nocardioides seonyuensis]QBX57332.1 hemerythrin domain-containing protein [Nocardioides seonyuensis]
MNQIIHAAVRRDIARTEQALRSFPEGDRSRASQLHGAWQHLVHQLTHHHEAEDANIWPFLESRGHDASLLAAMEEEHAAMKVTLSSASAALDDLVQEPTTAQASTAADAVAEAGRVTNTHLDHEERDVEPLVAALEDDPEWRAVAKRLRPASIVDAANALAWMQDGAGERELSSLRATIPGPVVSVMTGLLGRRYSREVAPTWR